MSATDKPNPITASGDDPEKAFKRARTHKLRESYRHNLLDEADALVVDFSVSDWKSIRLFLTETPGSDNNPGGAAFNDILEDAKDAIAEKDAERFFLNLMLIYKAVGRV